MHRHSLHISRNSELLDPFRNSEHPWVRRFFNSQIERVLDDVCFFSQMSGVQTVLNVGASPFLFEFLLRQSLGDVDLRSLDLAPDRFTDLIESVDIHTAKLDIETCRIEELLAVSGSPDVIVLAEVLEHLRHDLLGTLSKLYRILPPGGLLYLTTPNGMALRQLRRFLMGRTGPSVLHEWGKLRAIGHMGHVREYSMSEVKALLKHVGFEIVSSRYRRHWASFFGGPRTIEYRVYKVLEWFLPVFRWNLVVLARKSAGLSSDLPSTSMAPNRRKAG